MSTLLRRSGLDILGDLPWGTHCCHFFQGRQDLLDTLLPYFKAGLQSREYCLWVTHEPVTEKEARRALRRHVPDADRYLGDRSIEIVSGGEVFGLAVEGRSNPEIGGHLSISVRTAESHRASILRKLGLRNQIDLVLYAHRRAPRYSAQTLR